MAPTLQLFGPSGSTAARQKEQLVKLKVLFVTDHKSIPEQQKRQLLLADIDAQFFTRVEAALDALERQSVDVVVTDLDLPGINGVAFLRRVQRLCPDVYRVVFSHTDRHRPGVKQALEDRVIEQWFENHWDTEALLSYFKRLGNNGPYSFI
jgi:DNA-binding NtrC family response regulator